MTMYSITTASAALAQIMKSEGSKKWEPYGQDSARIELPNGKMIIIDRQRIEDAAASTVRLS